MSNYPPDVCDELLEVLRYVPKGDYEKIPREVLANLYANCNSESTFVYNRALPFNEQNLSGGTVEALKDFMERYWSEK